MKIILNLKDLLTLFKLKTWLWTVFNLLTFLAFHLEKMNVKYVCMTGTLSRRFILNVFFYFFIYYNIFKAKNNKKWDIKKKILVDFKETKEKNSVGSSLIEYILSFVKVYTNHRIGKEHNLLSIT